MINDTPAVQWLQRSKVIDNVFTVVIPIFQLEENLNLFVADFNRILGREGQR